jgi:NADP-dependent 3-hydroxy acid dehydrogenase YdfG
VPERLDGTVALVTGASSGIGRASALSLAAQGASVAIVARRRDRLETLAATIRSGRGRPLILAADITNASEAAAVVEDTVAEFGRLDTVVNGAGVMLTGDSVDSPLENWERMIDLNLRALTYITKAALPHLLESVVTSSRSVSDVVNVSSVAGRVISPRTAIYNATKFAVTAATESWRQEYTRQGIRFSVIEPGAVDTELSLQQESTRVWLHTAFAGREILHAQDIADAIAYIITNPRRVAVNEIVIRPTDQL